MTLPCKPFLLAKHPWIGACPPLPLTISNRTRCRAILRFFASRRHIATDPAIFDPVLANPGITAIPKKLQSGVIMAALTRFAQLLSTSHRGPPWRRHQHFIHHRKRAQACRGHFAARRSSGVAFCKFSSAVCRAVLPGIVLTKRKPGGDRHPVRPPSRRSTFAAFRDAFGRIRQVDSDSQHCCRTWPANAVRFRAPLTSPICHPRPFCVSSCWRKRSARFPPSHLQGAQRRSTLHPEQRHASGFKPS